MSHALLSRDGSQICSASHDLAGQERQRMSLNFDVPDVFVMGLYWAYEFGERRPQSQGLYW